MLSTGVGVVLGAPASDSTHTRWWHLGVLLCLFLVILRKMSEQTHVRDHRMLQLAAEVYLLSACNGVLTQWHTSGSVGFEKQTAQPGFKLILLISTSPV
jgi:hypothetical protein